MCRLAAWIGTSLPLSALTHDAPHSLLVQSHQPKEMRETRLNADGVGAAWYPDDGVAEPVRFRSPRPIWSEENLASLAPRARARVLLAVVRSATPGLEVGPASTPPFVHGRLAFMHNGLLEPFRTALMRPLRARLGDASYALLAGATDTEHVFALFVERLGADASPMALGRALADTVRIAGEVARAASGRAVLNVVVSNGNAVVAVRHAVGAPAASLYFAQGARGYEGGVVFASEPLTQDAAWLPVPEGVVIVADGSGHVERLTV